MAVTDDFDQHAYQAAHDSLPGRYNGDIHATAVRIARILFAQQERHGLGCALSLAQSYTARVSIVTQLAGHAETAGVRGGAEHALPLLDNAVAVAARALWDGVRTDRAEAGR